MASDGVNTTEDTEMAECDGDQVVTMVDVLQQQQDFEEDANAVLGASDENNCTYSQGYIKRQAIYACITCCPEAKTDPTKRAGVCLACSLSCHENHELIELYTKRNFRCDCGNPKFNSNPCQFTPNKDDPNANNIYNHNFSGLYCTCQRPYPDPDATVDEDMIQCIICEDWYHASHLDTVVPANDQYSEMICKGCMDKNDFLHDYTCFAVNNEFIEVDDIHSEKGADSLCNGSLNNEVEMTEDKKESSNINEEHIVPSIDLNNAQVVEVKSLAECTVNDSINDKEEPKEYVPTTDNIDKTSEPVLSSSEQNNETLTEASTEIEESTPQMENVEADNILNSPSDNTSKEPKEENSKNESSQSIPPVSKNVAAESIDNESVEKQKDDAINDNTVKSSREISNGVDTKAVSENSTEVSGTQDVKLDNADAVMDAIDELLEGPKESINNDTTEQNEKPSEQIIANENNANDTETFDKSVDTEIPHRDEKEDTLMEAEAVASVSNGNTDTDIEMTNNEIVDENSGLNREHKELIENEPPTVIDDKPTKTDQINGDISHKNEALNAIDRIELQESHSSSENKRKFSDELTGDNCKKPKLDVEKCTRPKIAKKMFKGATFWSSNFRQQLCTCAECLSMYKDLHVLFLTDLEDTVSFYEGLGQQKLGAGTSQYERGLESLSSLDRIQQINALTEYNNMRDRLLDFLKSFKDRQEVVKEEDIKAFFAEMKPRREPDGVYFCR